MRKKTCPGCFGNGVVAGDNLELCECTTCHGTRYVSEKEYGRLIGNGKQPETQYQIAMRLLDLIVMTWAEDAMSTAHFETDVVKETMDFMIQYHGGERYGLNHDNNQ